MPSKPISDRKIIAIADEIGDGLHTVKLAVNLGLGGTKATSLDYNCYKVLCTARDNIAPRQQRQKLRDGLIGSGFTAQADKHLPMRKKSVSNQGDVSTGQKRKMKTDPPSEHLPADHAPPVTYPTPPKKPKGKVTLKEEEARLKKEEKELKAMKKQVEELKKDIERKVKGIDTIKNTIKTLMEKQIKDAEKKLEKQREHFNKIQSAVSTSVDHPK